MGRGLPAFADALNPPIRNAHICPYDSAGYYIELLCTNSQMDYTNGFDECVGQLQCRLGGG